jgi:hypothetical protein
MNRQYSLFSLARHFTVSPNAVRRAATILGIPRVGALLICDEMAISAVRPRTPEEREAKAEALARLEAFRP